MGSNRFFCIIVAIFIVQVLWLAISARSLPFDEYYHFGVTQIYSEQWSPWISEQSYQASLYGDITRTHSYLYHYLMSFPLRLAMVFTDSIASQTVLLRFINIGFAVTAILAFRRLFIEAKVPKTAINIATAFFVATPIVPTLAAHINYDNLILLLTPLQLRYGLRMYKGDRSIGSVAMFSLIALFGGLIKHLYLVIPVILGGLIVYRWIKDRRSLRIKIDISGYPRIAVLVVAAALVVVAVLFAERHIGNMIRFGTVDVACEQVQPRSVCHNASPWRRNQEAIKRKQGPPEKNVAEYLRTEWLTKMTKNAYSVYTNIPLDVPIEDNPYGHYVAKPRILPHPYLGIGLAVISVALVVLAFRFRMNSVFDSVIIVLFVLHAILVFAYNYRIYMKYGQPYAIQPRYMVHLLLPLLAVIATAAKQVAGRVLAPTLRGMSAYLVLLVLVLYTITGGVVGWLARADDNWYWDNATIVTVNKALQEKVFGHLY